MINLVYNPTKNHTDQSGDIVQWYLSEKLNYAPKLLTNGFGMIALVAVYHPKTGLVTLAGDGQITTTTYIGDYDLDLIHVLILERYGNRFNVTIN